jgi:hypothetical protein
VGFRTWKITGVYIYLWHDCHDYTCSDWIFYLSSIYTFFGFEGGGMTKEDKIVEEIHKDMMQLLIRTALLIVGFVCGFVSGIGWYVCVR